MQEMCKNDVEHKSSSKMTIHEERWNAKYESLVEYKNEHGNVIVPKKGPYEKLAQWINDQNKAFNKGKLKPARQHKLEQLGIIFGKVKEDTWEAHIKEWNDLRARHGPINGTESFCSAKLKQWVRNIRFEHRARKEGRKGQGRKLDKERRAQLAEIGFDLDFGAAFSVRQTDRPPACGCGGGGTAAAAANADAVADAATVPTGTATPDLSTLAASIASGNVNVSDLLAALGTSKDLQDLTYFDINNLVRVKIDEVYGKRRADAHKSHMELRDSLKENHREGQARQDELLHAHSDALITIHTFFFRMMNN